jgi:hypothetical protein
MKEPYREGVASHPGPELCGGNREVAAEALVGVRAGRTLSSEINLLACRPCSLKGKTT